eukprot:Phypoly_transcript_12522.p1 GENE.Phypoly_transcript_12522~~Phypoly_transcript_12522.p1  ORF type:complete len:307 (+),score=39.39 Phypoly_transcript_12522:193-1113(+)
MLKASYPIESTADVDLTVPYCLGIDEAGRGPVLGAMVYGVCYYPVSDEKIVKKMGFADSKTLTEAQRDNLFQKIVDNSKHNIRYATAVLSPQELSYKMLRINKYNLNWISHDAAIGLIRKVLAKGVNVTEVYVDTVGDPAKYQGKLANLFPNIPTIVVAKKADSIYPVVSAASICAKVIRDMDLKNWIFTEKDVAFSNAFGSGYPADPYTKKWLKASVDPVFGYPSVIRFSWKTCTALLDANAVQVTWRGDDEEEDDEPWRDKKRKSPGAKPRTPNKTRKLAFFAKPTSNRFRYFADNRMEVVTQL